MKRIRTYTPNIDTIKNSKLIKFLLVGMINSLFGYTVFFLLIFLKLLDYNIALLIATICGVLFNFKTIGTIVFKNGNNTLIIRFITVYLFIYVINLLFLQIAIYLTVNLLLAQAALLFPMAIISYCLNKTFVFNSKVK